MNNTERLIGLATYALLFTGTISLLFGLWSATDSAWIGAGLSLIASALSFGLLLNALLK